MSHSRKRRMPSGFEWNSDETQPSENLSRTTRIRHTNVNFDVAGAASTSTAFITAPASPEKRSGTGPTDISSGHAGDDDVMPSLSEAVYPDSDDEGDDDALGEAELDPQYQDHLDYDDVSNAPCVRTKKTPAVSNQWNCHGILADC